MPFSYLIKGHLFCILTQITTMSNIRLVENELKADKRLYLIAMLNFYAFDTDFYDSFDEAVLGFNNMLREIEISSYWKDGRHDGDCTKQCHSCFRCLVEEFTDEAKEMISKYLES